MILGKEIQMGNPDSYEPLSDFQEKLLLDVPVLK
jgi:hypothetical protein